MRWKRVLGWTALAIVVLIGGCAVLLDRLLPGAPCSTAVFAEVRSPHGWRTAVVYEIDCGATTGFSRQVVILPTPERRTDSDDLPHGFFAVTLGSGVDSRLSMRDSLIRLQWLSENQLDIAYPAGARLIRSAGRSEGVDITYSTYATP